MERGFRAPILVTQPSCLAEFCGPSLLPSLFVVWFAFLRSIFSPTSFLLRLSCCFCLFCPLRAYSLLPTVFSPPSFLPSFLRLFPAPFFFFPLPNLSSLVVVRSNEKGGSVSRRRPTAQGELLLGALGQATRLCYEGRRPKSSFHLLRRRGTY